MNMVRFERGKVPPLTKEQEARMRALAERPDSEIDCSDIPEQDELEFKYSIPAAIYNVLNNRERSELGRKLLVAEQAERAAKKAGLTAERVPVEA